MSEPIISKNCSKCKQSKPISEFHKDRSNKDGLRFWCKSCEKAYRQSERGKSCQKAYKQSKKGKAVDAKYYARNPNYVKAHNAINSAVRYGKLPRPDSLQCHYCDAQAEEYHHHLGYEPEHWLDVIPVCKECHRLVHKMAS